MKPHTLKTAVSLALATTLGSASSVAQESSSTTARLMEEIVVSARGIEEGLQDAPTAVSAFTGETLDYRGVDSLDQICLLYTSPSPRDRTRSRMPSSA